MKNIAKITLSVLLMLSSLFVITPTVVHAAEDDTTGIKIVEKSYDAGTNIMTVAVQMKLPAGSEGITGFQTYVSYDNSRLTLMHKSADSTFSSSGSKVSAFDAVDLKLLASGGSYGVTDSDILSDGSRTLMKVTGTKLIGSAHESQKITDWQDVFTLRFKVNGNPSEVLNSASLRIANPIADEMLIDDFQSGGTANSWTAYFTTVNGGKQHVSGKMVDNTSDEIAEVVMKHAENATATYTGSGNTPPVPPYTGTQAGTPTVNSKVGGKVTLDLLTVAGETVEYASATTATAPTDGWKTSNVFESLSAGTHYFFARVQATDAHGAGEAKTSASVTVFAAPTLSYTAPGSMTIDTAITAMNPTLAGGSGSGTYTLDSGTLPTGITMNSSGVISGTPTVAGAATSVTIRYSDSEGQQVDEVIDFPEVSKLTNTVLFTSAETTIVEGSSYSFTATATDGTPSLHFTGRNGTSYNDTTQPTAIGDYTVTASVSESVKYMEGRATHNFSIISKTVSKVEVTTTKTNYIEGIALDKSTIDVKITYNDTSTSTVKGDAAGVSITGFDSTSVGPQTVTVSFGGKQDTFDVNVAQKQLLSISFTGTLGKTTYVAFETFLPTGLTVHANYDNGSSEVISDYTVLYEDSNSSFEAGDTSVTVSYNGKTALVHSLIVNKTTQPYTVDSSKKITLTSGSVDLRTLVANVQESAAISFTLDDDGSTGSLLNADGYTLEAGGTIGNVTIGVDVATTANYEAASTTLTVEVVDKQTTTVNIDSTVTNRTYGDDPFTLSASATEEGTGTPTWNWVSGDDSILSVDAATGVVTVKAVGTTSITANFSSDTHAGSASKTITVDPKQLQWQDAGSVNNKEYDGTTTATLLAAPTLSGVLASDVGNVTVNTSGAIYNFANKDVANGISVSASGFDISGSASGNYAAPTSNPSFNAANITQKSITVTANNASRKYGENNSTFTFSHTPSDFVGGDDVSAISVTLNTTATSTSDVGTYSITGSATSRNYFVTVTDGTLTVDKALKSDETLAATGKQGEANTVNLASWSSLKEVSFAYASKNPNNDSIVDGTPTLSGSILNYNLAATATLGGNVGSIVVNVESKNHETFKVTIYLSVTKETPQTLVFDAGSVSKIMGSDATTFTNNLSGANTTVNYSSNNEQVATVNNSGEVTIHAPGTAVIKANAASETIGGNKYLAAEQSYKLTVHNGLLTLDDETTIFAGDLDDVTGISIDSTALTRDASGNLSGVSGYTVNNGVVGKVTGSNIKVVLYKEFLAYLSAGNHTLTVQAGTTDATTFDIPLKTPHDLTITNEGDGELSGITNYTVGDIITVTAGSRSGYNFAGWTAVGVKLVNASSNTVTFVMMDSDASLTSKWVKEGSSNTGSDSDSDDETEEVVKEEETSKPLQLIANITYYDIEVEVEGMGKISPDGGNDSIVRVKNGEETTFEFVADSGYVISDVLVNNISVGAKETYTFDDINEDVTLKVIFIEDKEVEDTSIDGDDSTTENVIQQDETMDKNVEGTENNSSMLVILMLVVVALGGAGAFVYFKSKNN